MKNDPLDTFAPMDDATKAAMKEFWPQDAVYAPPIQEPFMYGTLDAVLAERERCAKIAERHVEALDMPLTTAEKIASKIRSGK